MNLIEKLSREIERVTMIREHAREIGAAGGFLVSMATSSIEAGHKAQSNQEIGPMILCVKDLESYKE